MTRPNDFEQSTIRDGPGPSVSDGPRFDALTILGHPDPARMGDLALLESIAHGNVCRVSRVEPEFVPPGGRARAPLGHPRVSRSPLRIEPGPNGGVRLDPNGLPADDVRIAGVPLAGPTDLSEAALEHGVVIVLGNSVVLLLHRRAQPIEGGEAHELVGASEALEALRAQIPRIADVSATVLLEGETGTGKERVAEAIHRAGPHRDAPFVSVNMAAIPAPVAASQLFGHVKGSFTGATSDHRGFFEQADGGTLFLDEIGETPPDVQPILLRALESGEIQPLGAAGTRTVRVRVLAATDTDLDDAVSAGRFRSPLLHRLAGFRMTLPPLRDRRDDIGRLLLAFLRTELSEIDESHRLTAQDPGVPPWVDPATVVSLAEYSWPGNVRELQNVVRQLVLSSRGRDRLAMDRALRRRLAAEDAETGDSGASRPARPADIDEDTLVETLRLHQWKTGATARSLGISRTSLYALMDQSARIRTARDLGADEIVAALAAHDGSVANAASELEVSKRALQLRIRELGIEAAGS